MLRGSAPEAVNALLGNVRDPEHRDHVRGIDMLLSRTDVVETRATVHHHVEVDHNTEAIEQLRMMKRLGVAHEKLIEMFGYSGLSRCGVRFDRRAKVAGWRKMPLCQLPLDSVRQGRRRIP
jgi:IS5 family transposase